MLPFCFCVGSLGGGKDLSHIRGTNPVSLRGDTREEGGATAVRLACLFREEKTDGPNVLEAVGGLERNAFDHRAVQAQIVQFPRAQCA